MSTDELERLVRKLNYHESIILKLLASASTNSKIVIVKEKIEQLEELVLDIPDCCGDLFDQWMDTVVQLWDNYSTAASAAGHRPQTTATTVSYPQPIVSSTTTPSLAPSSEASGHRVDVANKSQQRRIALAPRPGALNGITNGLHHINGAGTNHHLSKHKAAKYLRNSGDDHYNSRH